MPSSTRRRFLRHSGLAAAGLFLGDGLRSVATETSDSRKRAKSVIMIFSSGAPSHIDLWDMKPNAFDTVRGPFRPIDTNVPGIRVSELMPALARQADRYAIVRTLHHTHTQHNSGMYWSIVGRPYRIDSTLINPSRADYPSFGTLVGWLAQQSGHHSPVPPYVITPSPHCDSSVYITPGQYGACLGARYDPLVLNADPNAADFRIASIGLADGLTAKRLDERRGLLEKVNNRQANPPALAEDFSATRARAFELVTSSEVQRAFDLTREPAKVRERYGRNSWGQSHLLARRLIESGVRFVSTVNGPSIIWDTHEGNFTRLKDRLVPPMQQAFAALLDDLAERGLLDSTLVVWLGDFGRTPTINDKAGRDHWPHCYSAVVAGGGIRGGQVIGESDATASYPRDRPVTPADLHATLFTALGYDPQGIIFRSPDGRPMPLSEGEAIRPLL